MFQFRNRYIQAFFDTVLVMASLHLTIRVIDAIVHHNYKLLNIFHIQNLNDFWPRIADGAVSFIAAALLGLAIYIWVLLNQRPKN